MKLSGPAVCSALIVSALLGCKKPAFETPPTSPEARRDPQELYSPGEREIAAKLKPARDTIMVEIDGFRKATGDAFAARRFADLERSAVESRTTQRKFGNGTWRLIHFYTSMECDDSKPESVWLSYERLHQDWIAALPESITARVAYAKFLTDHAWHARGSDYASNVPEEGWRLFRERLYSAWKVLEDSRGLPEKDYYWWVVALKVSLGQEWSQHDFDKLLAEAKAFDPKCWGYDVSRAYSLLPRWYGNPGDWEAYAAEAVSRPEGPGAEAYTRVVIRLRGFYDNIFRDTKVSWPKTRDGLRAMREQYPDSIEVLSHCAMLGTMASDRDFAKEAFAALGDRYVASVWSKPERMAHYRHWTETGTW